MVDQTELSAALRGAGLRDVADDPATCAAYSSDASLYRLKPAVVVRPRAADEVLDVLAVCRELGVPVVARGAGTSVAGNAVGAGVVLDFSRHMDRVIEIDPDARTAVVQPGVVQARLQRATAAHGLRFGPDPSTSSRCTIGGMIGNDACGTRSLAYGRTSENVLGLDLVTASGELLRLSRQGRPGQRPRVIDALDHVVRGDLATIRTEFGRLRRQVSGYALENLLPERGFDVARTIVGSEGTLGLVTQATVRLVTEPAHRVLVALGFADIAAAGDAAAATLPFDPTACEGLDARIVDVLRARRGEQAVPELPRGAAWLFVELAGDDRAELRGRAAELARACDVIDSAVVDDPVRAAALWRIRADGAGLAGRSPAGLPAHAGWEDAAVPPERLGDYLRDFDRLMRESGVTGLPYGHFGDGCLHIRIDLPLGRAGGVSVFRSFIEAAATLVAGYGGSFSGEHGDGRARSELLPRMYSPAAIRLFGQVKAVFDPENLLNPGVLVDPRPLDADLRVPAALPRRTGLAWAYTEDGGDFTQAVHRCTGVGKCRADNSAAGGVMCPSYLATRNEKDSTRGRARVLQEMLSGSATVDGWGSPAVRDALDLCLACKGCASDCPTGVDMAMYKAEALYQAYKGRIRPMSHYTLGWLPRWSRLAGRMPRVVNAGARMPVIGPLALSAAGVDPRRRVPDYARESFRSWFARTTAQRRPGGAPVVLFVDSFTNWFSPEVGVATVRVLEAAGYRPRLTSRQECCGLTWISTGQLDAAKKILGRTVTALREAAAPGTPVVGVEPSCTAVLRSDAVELLATDVAKEIRSATRTLAELLAERGWEPPSLTGRQVVAQPHCHHHAVLGWDADAALLDRTGADVERLSGCCGLAGNFGVEKGHYDVSVAVARQQLLPAVERVSPGVAVLADGFSCRTQLADLAGRRGMHLAQLLAEGIDESTVYPTVDSQRGRLQ
ncbi:FAD-binding protein [Amycolatopsis sp. K13G38]|uniref:FAD-binding protein n=1 Tax=Amycolatopsis acididurans TaxID=2724524 RepID=A0ABX1JD06_9PSEU|nr:FAD-binding and (Fe-S)-binding domain-containing protein [Amycolatopsis acididurans]NKQ56152.1 FAD-binding protein [Amycolatopsis acididurans]